MPRLVALRILSDQAGNIGRWVVAVYLGADRKQRIEFGDERIAAAEQIHQPLAVVRHEESPLPRSAFAEIVVRPVVVRMERIERRPPTAVGIPAAHKVQILIEKILIPAGPADVIVVVVPVPEHPRHLSDAPVVVAIFEGLRNGSHLQIARYVLVLLVITRPAERFQKITERIAVGRRFHRLVKRFRIVTANPFAISVGNQRHRMITDHAHVLDAGQRPDRQLTAVAVVLQQGFHQIAGHVRPENRDQRVLRPERIPKAQHAGEITEIALIYLRVGTAVFARHIGIEHRVEHREIETRIKHLLLRRIGIGDPDSRQGFVPVPISRFPDFIEIPSFDLGPQILPRAVHTDRGDAHTDDDRFSRLPSETQHGPHVGTFQLTDAVPKMLMIEKTARNDRL